MFSKAALFIFVLSAALVPDLLAADMTDVVSRAADLNMTVQDYEFAMAISGTMAGSLFGLFLWKVK